MVGGGLVLALTIVLGRHRVWGKYLGGSGQDLGCGDCVKNNEIGEGKSGERGLTEEDILYLKVSVFDNYIINYCFHVKSN